MTPEEWHKQWDDYFDELDSFIKQIDELSDKADDAGLLELSETLGTAASRISALSIKIAQFVDIRNFEMVTEIYKQNPLLNLLMKNDMAMSPYMKKLEEQK